MSTPCPPATIHLQDTNHPSACPPQCCSSTFSLLDADQFLDLMTKARTTSSSLDPLPTTLVKACLPTLCPAVVTIINASLSSGVVPSNFKLVIQTLKKPGLDPDDPNNYHPISNLPFLSKILERAVAAQLQHHVSHHKLFKLLQSRFRSIHSNKTDLIKITNDLLNAADDLFTILFLLDLSAAFDTSPKPSASPVSLSSLASPTQHSPCSSPNSQTENNSLI